MQQEGAAGEKAGYGGPHQPPRAFVLIPFDPEFEPIYAQLIRPGLESAGYEVIRADSFIDQQNILRDVIRGIATATLVVADITALNPNVLYELGLSHGLGIPTVLLAQSMDEVPFDLRAYRIQTYSTHFAETHQLIDSLREIGQKHLEGSVTFGSPISDFLPREYASLPAGQVGAAPDTPAEQEVQAHEEAGILDFVAEGEEASTEITRIFEDLSNETAIIGSKIKAHTAKLESLLEHTGPGRASRVQAAAIAVASDFDKYADRLEGRLPEVDRNIDLMTESLGGFARFVTLDVEEGRENLVELRKSVEGLLEGARGGLKGTRAFRESVHQAREFSRAIRRASGRITSALDRVIAAMERVEAFCVKTIQLIDERLADYN